MGRLVTCVGNGLSGAVMLATGRPAGALRVEGDLAGAARSFWAAPLAVPMLLCLRLIDWTVSGVPATPAIDLASSLLVFAVGWAGFAVISHAIVGRIGRQHRWPAYIAVWNWCNIIQYALLLAAAIPMVLSAPPPVSEATELIAFGWAVWLEWFATRLTLGLAPLGAAAMVALDLLVGLVLAGS